MLECQLKFKYPLKLYFSLFSEINIAVLVCVMDVSLQSVPVIFFLLFCVSGQRPDSTMSRTCKTYYHKIL